MITHTAQQDAIAGLELRNYGCGKGYRTMDRRKTKKSMMIHETTICINMRVKIHLRGYAVPRQHLMMAYGIWTTGIRNVPQAIRVNAWQNRNKAELPSGEVVMLDSQSINEYSLRAVMCKTG